MRIAFTTALFLILSVQLSAAETPWETYLATPTPENASRVVSITYSPGSLRAAGSLDYLDRLLLNQQIRSGDAEAYLLAIRIARTTDSAAGLEDLNASIGGSIRANPAVFLSVAKRASLTEAELRRVLFMTGEHYVDRADAKRFELKLRREAIASVDDSALRGTQEMCLAILDVRLSKHSK